MSGKGSPDDQRQSPTVVAPDRVEAFQATVVAPSAEALEGATLVTGPPPRASGVTTGSQAGLASGELLPDGGEVLGGRFRILGLLGQGGMGCVYQVRDLELDEVVALKMLRRDRVATADDLERFHREARLARRVTHPNVARIFDIGEHGPEKFLTMEYVEGESLDDLLARQGPMPLTALVGLGRQICAGLAAAHQAGVIHRDLKPGNVLLEAAGRAVITDFGIARDTGPDAPGAARGSPTIGVIGTPAYMAPEQVEGSVVDARTDLYALGAMLYELATGNLPFSGSSPLAVAAARLTGAPADPRRHRDDLDAGLAALLLRCLARRPEDRFASATELGTALAALLPDARITASRDRLPPPMVARPAQAPARPGFLAWLAEADRFIQTLAVLPMRNAGQPEDQHWAQGFTLDLTESLSLVPHLKVRSGAALRAEVTASSDPRQLGEALGVGVVLEGSVRRRGELLRVQVRLVSVADGFQIWAQRFDRSQGDLLAIAEEAAAAVAAALVRPPAAASRPVLRHPGALDLYLRARHEYQLYTATAMARAVSLLEEALRLAPDEPRLLAALASTYVRAWAVDSELKDARGRALATAERALALAPDLGDPHVALALLRLQENAAAGAIHHIRCAVMQAPGLASGRDVLGRMLLEVDRLDLAVPQLEMALSLEPDLVTSRVDVARAHALLGDREKADAALDPAVVGPSFAAWVNRRRLRCWFDPRPIDWMADARAANADAMVVALCQMVEVEVQGTAAALPSLIGGGPARRRDAFLLQLRVEVALHSGHRERALQLLEVAPDYCVTDLTWLRRCPLMDPVKDEPRYRRTLSALEARAAELMELLSS